MSKSLDGYAVLITGGSTGLGLSHARVLGSRGARVAITDFKQEISTAPRPSWSVTASPHYACVPTIASSPK